MTKNFCDKCGIEVTDQQLQTSLTMTGKVYCHSHMPNRESKAFSITWDEVRKRKTQKKVDWLHINRMLLG